MQLSDWLTHLRQPSNIPKDMWRVTSLNAVYLLHQIAKKIALKVAIINMYFIKLTLLFYYCLSVATNNFLSNFKTARSFLLRQVHYLNYPLKWPKIFVIILLCGVYKRNCIVQTQHTFSSCWSWSCWSCWNLYYVYEILNNWNKINV